ncbi:protein of unknown function [Burkholderia multivorans]
MLTVAPQRLLRVYVNTLRSRRIYATTPIRVESGRPGSKGGGRQEHCSGFDMRLPGNFLQPLFRQLIPRMTYIGSPTQMAWRSGHRPVCGITPPSVEFSFRPISAFARHAQSHAGPCGAPLAAIVFAFRLTHDANALLPLLAASPRSAGRGSRTTPGARAPSAHRDEREAAAAYR